MRAIHKSWQNKRPGFTKRVRWYHDEYSIRLNFYDLEEGREINVFYGHSGEQKELAQRDFDAFAAGTITCQDLLNGQHAAK